MRTLYRFTPTVLVVLLCFVTPSSGQDAPAEATVIELLQGKGVLADEDVAALKEWVRERVQAATSDNSAAAKAAIADLRSSGRGTPVFQEAYVGECVEAISAAYPQANRAAAARLIAVLSLLKDIQTYHVFVQALGDERAPVRAAAAIGLRNLQTKIAAGGSGVFGEVIAGLRDAGIREESAIGLKLIYRALTFANPPDAKTVAEAVVALLGARGEQYGAGNVKAVGGDRAGLTLAGKLTNELDENGRRRLAVAAARMLQYSVDRYTRELYKLDDKTNSPMQIQLRNRVELLIEAAELLLTNLTRPDNAPSIISAMQDSVLDEKSVNMKIEMNKWGDLVQQAYQIDVHMDVTEPDDAESP